MTNPELIKWIAENPSDLAERFRAVLRPALNELVTFINSFDFGWGDHRHIMRRKIRRMAREIGK